MRPIHTYLEHQERKLLLDYEGIRKTHKDPDVKGTVNEGIVAEFLTKHMAGRGIAKNSEIIDSYGDRSDECDVCVCNEDQPFHATSGDVLIAEGVDCVIQVKGCLTGTEIDRTIKNCRSVKQLRRRAREGELTHTHKDDIKYHLERIPYFVLALSSRVSLETATLRYW